MTTLFARHALLPSGPARDVRIEVAGGRFTTVTPAAPPPPEATRLSGVVLPGLANAHSHAFHRALRGRTHAGGGTFWTWRDAMYSLASRLDPDNYLALARAVYAEMALADGIGPARALADAGVRLSLGSDQNAVVDLIGEARALESGERLASLERGRFRPDELLAAATAHGSLGWADAGAIAPGMRADLVCVRLDTVRTAGVDPAQVLLAATAADIDSVWVDGTPVVSGGTHRLGDVAGLLSDAIGDLWTDS